MNVFWDVFSSLFFCFSVFHSFLSLAVFSTLTWKVYRITSRLCICQLISFFFFLKKNSSRRSTHHHQQKDQVMRHWNEPVHWVWRRRRRRRTKQKEDLTEDGTDTNSFKDWNLPNKHKKQYIAWKRDEKERERQGLYRVSLHTPLRDCVCVCVCVGGHGVLVRLTLDFATLQKVYFSNWNDKIKIEGVRKKITG